MRFGTPLLHVATLLSMAGFDHAAAAEQFASQRAVMSVSATVIERCTASSHGGAAASTSTNHAAQLANFSVQCTSGRTSGYSASMRQHTVFAGTDPGSSGRFGAFANPQQSSSAGDAAELRFRVDY